MGGFRIRALAIAIRCFCPPERFVPLSPRSVSNPSGSSIISLYISAFFAALVISSSVAFVFPNDMLSLMELENKKVD